MQMIDIPIAIAIWVGHACIWTATLNVLYSQALPKTFLKPWRLFTGAVIGGFPLLQLFGPRFLEVDTPWLLNLYFGVCCLIGLVIFPTVTLIRCIRSRPKCLTAERTETLDLWATLGAAVRGDGKWRWLTRLPGNSVFKVDITELTLTLPRLPAPLDGLSILLLSDLHFHGTPSKLWFDAILDRLSQLPKPDIVVLAGDYVDSDEHHEWIGIILGRLQWNEVGVAILGNHDAHHQPEQLRNALEILGYMVLGDRSHEVTCRGERLVFTGHEGPWFPGPASVPAAGFRTPWRPVFNWPPRRAETTSRQSELLPELLVDQLKTGRHARDCFRICVSHSPDSFRWAAGRGFDLILCGHVHGGQIRLPLIGSIFVPSRYSRRYDMGVFERDGTAMVVGRGLSGKEPLRFRCHPQVIRIVLRCV